MSFLTRADIVLAYRVGLRFALVYKLRVLHSVASIQLSRECGWDARR